MSEILPPPTIDFDDGADVDWGPLAYSPYAPVRLRDEYWWHFARGAAQEGMLRIDGRVRADFHQQLEERLLDPITQTTLGPLSGANVPPDLVTARFQLVAKLYEIRHWAPLVAQYELNGRQIFDFNDTLVEMLAHTDHGECTLADWHPPFDAFFVRFGKQDEFKLQFGDDFEYLDGAFVAVTPWDETPGSRRIKFGFTTVLRDGRGVTLPGHFLDLAPDEQNMPIDQAVSVALARRIAGLSEGPVPESDEPTNDPVEFLRRSRVGTIEEAAEIMRQGATLLVNALFYLESVGAPQATQPGRDTPLARVAAWMNAPPTRHHKMRSQLTSDGYAVVYLMGQELMRGASPARDTGSKRAHWRRGHWRMQRHGPQLSLRKRLWMKPVMVNAHQAHEDMPGRITVVTPPSDHRH